MTVGLGSDDGVAKCLEQLDGKHGEGASKCTEGVPRPNADAAAGTDGVQEVGNVRLTYQGHINAQSAGHVGVKTGYGDLGLT